MESSCFCGRKFSLQLHHNFILEKISRDGWMNLDKPVMFPWSCSFFPWTPPSDSCFFRKLGSKFSMILQGKTFQSSDSEWVSVTGEIIIFRYDGCICYPTSINEEQFTVHTSCYWQFVFVQVSYDYFFGSVKITPEENLSKQMNKKRCITMHVYSVLPSAVQLGTTWP